MINHGRLSSFLLAFFCLFLISDLSSLWLSNYDIKRKSNYSVMSTSVRMRLDSLALFSTKDGGNFGNKCTIFRNAQHLRISASNIMTRSCSNMLYATITTHSKILAVEKKIQAKKYLTNQVNLYQNHVKLASAALTKAKIKVSDLPFNPMDQAFKKDLEVKVSSSETPYPCRIYIDAEPGSKVVAPCKCRGTQKWIQLAALNRQRRLEPEKWIRCSVCNSEINYATYHRYVPQLLRIISWPLDHRERTKLILGGLMTILGIFAAVPLYYIGVNIIASGFFWRYYHLWSWVVYGALPLKLVVVRFVLGYIISLYSATEKLIRENLTELETSILELSIPIST